ncbi:Rieske (2Fe-2S) protein [Spongisporangium articulatum]|uniref:Rieske (2Fe-2S) protein n=1 Tax=Spongisporangium articulatum TaxID=3362603 RepID=A0ABW8AML7_9ACTN
MTDTTALPTGPARRTMIVTAGAACLVGGGLAACSSDSGSAGGSDTGTGASADGGSSAAAGSTVIAVADAPLEKAVPATIGGEEVLVTRTGDSTAVAYSPVCPHQGGHVAQQGTKLVCPLHGSTFALDTGDVTQGPATKGLTTFDVKVDGANIVTA